MVDHSDKLDSKLSVQTEPVAACFATSAVGDAFLDEPDSHIPLPLWRKLTFAVGGFPMQLMQNILAFFLPIFLLETVKLAPAYLSAIQLTARVSDALTDPIVGFLVLKTKSKVGRKRPWILLSTPVFVLSFFAIFYTMSWDSSVAKFSFYMAAIICLQIGLTSFHVPYSSMTMVLTNCPEERDTLTAYRMFSEVLAILLGVAVFGAIVAPYRIATTCEASLSAGNITVVPPAEAVKQEINAYIIAAGSTCAISALAALICFFGTREIELLAEEGKTPAEGTLGFFSAVKCVLTYRPYVLHMGSFLFLSLAIQFIQGNIALYITHSLAMNGYLIPGIMTLLSVAIALLPFAQFLIHKVGKKATLALGIFNMMPLLILLFFIPEQPPLWVFFPMMAWAGFTIAVAMLLPWSMLPDVIDAFYLEYNMRKEPVFYCLIVFFNKFAVGVSLAMSAGVLGLVGYDVDTVACNQIPEVGDALRYLCSICPAVLFVPSLVFLYFYPLGNRELGEMRSKLLLRSNASALNILQSSTAIHASSAGDLEAPV